MAGAMQTGLDYAGVLAWLQASGIPRHSWPRLMGDLQACETAALDVWARQARKKQD